MFVFRDTYSCVPETVVADEFLNEAGKERAHASRRKRNAFCDV